MIGCIGFMEFISFAVFAKGMDDDEVGFRLYKRRMYIATGFFTVLCNGKFTDNGISYEYNVSGKKLSETILQITKDGTQVKVIR